MLSTEDNELVTRQTDNGILAGITRGTLKKIAGDLQLKFVERPFTLAEAKKAKEAFITSATSFVTPVVKIDVICASHAGPRKANGATNAPELTPVTTVYSGRSLPLVEPASAPAPKAPLAPPLESARMRSGRYELFGRTRRSMAWRRTTLGCGDFLRVGI